MLSFMTFPFGKVIIYNFPLEKPTVDEFPLRKCHNSLLFLYENIIVEDISIEQVVIGDGSSSRIGRHTY